MSTIVLLLVVAILIGGFSYFTNAGWGDRRPSEGDDKKKDQDSGDEPPPSR